MCDIQSPTAERKKEERKQKIETTAAKHNGLPLLLAAIIKTTVHASRCSLHANVS